LANLKSGNGLMISAHRPATSLANDFNGPRYRAIDNIQRNNKHLSRNS